MSTPPRFSDDELIDIITGTRLLSAVFRDTRPDRDRVDIALPHRPGHFYRFERDSTGWTYLLFATADQFKLVIAGELVECLALFGGTQP
jgi:hypothetical protein